MTVSRGFLKAAWDADTATREFTGPPDFTQTFAQFAQTRFTANTNTGKNAIKYAVALAQGEGLATDYNNVSARILAIKEILQITS